MIVIVLLSIWLITVTSGGTGQAGAVVRRFGPSPASARTLPARRGRQVRGAQAPGCDHRQPDQVRRHRGGEGAGHQGLPRCWLGHASVGRDDCRGPRHRSGPPGSRGRRNADLSARRRRDRPCGRRGVGRDRDAHGPASRRHRQPARAQPQPSGGQPRRRPQGGTDRPEQERRRRPAHHGPLRRGREGRGAHLPDHGRPRLRRRDHGRRTRTPEEHRRPAGLHLLRRQEPARPTVQGLDEDRRRARAQPPDAHRRHRQLRQAHRRARAHARGPGRRRLAGRRHPLARGCRRLGGRGRAAHLQEAQGPSNGWTTIA